MRISPCLSAPSLLLVLVTQNPALGQVDRVHNLPFVVSEAPSAADVFHSNRADDGEELQKKWMAAKRHHEHGEENRVRGAYSSAIEDFRRGESLMQEIVTADPLNEIWMRDLYLTRHKIGDVMLASGDVANAERNYQKALTGAQALSESRPQNREWQRNVHVIQNKLGDVLMKRRQYTAALAAYDISMKIAQRLSVSEPSNLLWLEDLSSSHRRIGSAKLALKDGLSAVEHFSNALELRKRLMLAAPPTNATVVRGTALAHGALATALINVKKLDQARDQLSEGRSLIERLLHEQPNSRRLRTDLVWFDQRLAALSQ
jgi:tetratricopeptide (TPR) repeat protein